MSGPNPATTEWVPIWNMLGSHHTAHEPGGGDVLTLTGGSKLFGRGASGAGAMQEISLGAGLSITGTVLSATVTGTLPHHATHETGGSDPIVVLDAGVITTGIFADARLSANVPLKNVANVFTANQLINKTNPEWQLLHSGTAKGHVFSYTEGNIGISANMTYLGGVVNLDNTALPGSWFQAYPDGGFYWYSVTAGANPRTLSSVMQLTAAGNLMLTGQLQVTGANPGIKLGGTTASFPALRANTGGVVALEVVSADTPSSVYLPIRASNFLSSSNGNNLVDLTCGSTNFTVGLTVTGGQTSTFAGPLYSAAYIYNTGVIYPGRVDVTGAQTSWYIAGHGSYGLYINTGLYVAGTIWTGANIYVGALGWLGNACIQNGISGTTGTILFAGVYCYMNFTNGVLTSTTPA